MYIRDKLQYNVKTKSVNLSRSGVYTYLGEELGLNDNEVYSVYRSPQTVQKTKEIIDNLGTIPVLINHPKDFVDLSDEMNYKNGGVGNIEVSKQKDIDYCSGEVIGLSDSIKAFMKKGQEVSLGFKAEIQKSSNPEHDFEMEITDVNHLAFVSNGRAGSACSIRDKANYKAIVLDALNINKKEKKMLKNKENIKDVKDAESVEESTDEEKESTEVEAKDACSDPKDSKKKEKEDKKEEKEEKEEAKTEVKAKDSKEIVDQAIIDEAYNKGFEKGVEKLEKDFNDFNTLRDLGVVTEVKDGISQTIESAVLKVLDKESFENDADRAASIKLVVSQAKKQGWNFQDMAMPKEKVKAGTISQEFFN